MAIIDPLYSSYAILPSKYITNNNQTHYIHIPEMPDINMLCEQLENESTSVRAEAQKTLVGMGQPAFIPLTQVFKTTRRSGFRVIVSMLKKINPAQAHDFVIAMMQDADPPVRLRALQSMSVLNPAVPVDVVIAALKDPDVEVRKTALRMLPASHDEVAEVMLHDSEADLRWAALIKLAEAGDKRATEPMMEKYKARKSNGDAIRWLAELQDVRSAPLLIDALADDSANGYATGTWRWVRRNRSPNTISNEAYAALRQLGHEARPALIAAIRHPNPLVRQKVHQLLELLS